MATTAQIAANQRNAKKSTGPRTAAGKERARMNALTHGMYASSADAVEDTSRRVALREQLLAEWSPGSILEVVLLDQIVDVTLKLDRVPEVNLAATGILRRKMNAPDHVSNAEVLAADLMSGTPRMTPVHRYEEKLSRQLLRLVRDLRRMQQDRVACDADAAAEAEAAEQQDAADEERNTEIGETNPISPQVPLEPLVVPAAIAAKSAMPHISDDAALQIGDLAELESMIPMSLSA